MKEKRCQRAEDRAVAKHRPSEESEHAMYSLIGWDPSIRQAEVKLQSEKPATPGDVLKSHKKFSAHACAPSWRADRRSIVR